MTLRSLIIVSLFACGGALVSCESTSSYLRADGTVDCEILYMRRCSQCHALYDPGDYTDSEWAQKVQRYGPRAGVAPHLRPLLVDWLSQANDAEAAADIAPAPEPAPKSN